MVSYHNHTTWSDGKNSIREMVEEAGRIGLAELGISDHYTLMPDENPCDWSMNLDRLDEYVESLQTARAPGVALLVGLEADYFPETVGELKRRISGMPFDFVIGSVHFVEDFPVDRSPAEWAPLSPGDVDSVWRRYWDRIRRMAESGAFDIAAHLDLPKKFGFRPAAPMEAEEQAALEAIARSEMSIEINTNGWNLPAAEAYPAPGILRRAREMEIPLIISSDAHNTARLIDHFARARHVAREAGYTELALYKSRRLSASVPLENP